MEWKGDGLHQEMQERTGHMMGVNTMFGFLTNMEYFMDSNKDEDIDSAIDLLTSTYTDIIAEGFKNEVRRVRRHITSFKMQTGEAVDDWNALNFLQWLVKCGHETSFPNLLVSLRTFLSDLAVQTLNTIP